MFFFRLSHPISEPSTLTTRVLQFFKITLSVLTSRICVCDLRNKLYNSRRVIKQVCLVWRQGARESPPKACTPFT